LAGGDADLMKALGYVQNEIPLSIFPFFFSLLTEFKSSTLSGATEFICSCERLDTQLDVALKSLLLMLPAYVF
jgi:hypothetical protein